MKPVISALLLVALLVSGCSPSVSPSSSGANGVYAGDYPIRALATVGMVADIVREVGGERVAVEQLLGAGVDPHLFKPTRDDVAQIGGADIVFYSGLMLEGKMADTLIKVGRDKPVFAVTEEIDESVLLEPEELEGHYDPHVWMDVAAWADCVDVVAAALAEFDPPHAEEYRARADRYREQLQALDAYGKESLATVPRESRVLITSHDAFGYFGRAYGLEVMGVQGLSTESETGLQRINELVDLIVDRQVKAVFVESSVPRKNIQALVDGAQSRGYQVTIGGELFSDAMGEAGTYEGTYVGMLDHNITRVTNALGGQAPATGLNGKLSAQHE